MLVVFASLCIAQQVDGVSISRNCNTVEDGKGKCFLVLPQGSSWEEANRECIRLGEGFTLASIESEQEQTALNEVIKSSGCCYGGWIGMQVGMTLEWVDNSPVEYTNFIYGAPTKRQDSEECITIWGPAYSTTPSHLDSPSGIWNDSPCNIPLRPICSAKNISGWTKVDVEECDAPEVRAEHCIEEDQQLFYVIGILTAIFVVISFCSVGIGLWGCWYYKFCCWKVANPRTEGYDMQPRMIIVGQPVGAPQQEDTNNKGSLSPTCQFLSMECNKSYEFPPEYGKRERERAPGNYGTVELTHSCKGDVAEEVVRSLYTFVGNGATRGARLMVSNLKTVYVPEEDLEDLAQVWHSKEMGDLRSKFQSEDGMRRCLRFFTHDGFSLKIGKE